jgi:two-component system cell cycle sensor histidine kinase/response regulator CckA
VILGYSDLMLSEMKADDVNHEPMTWIKDAALRAASLTRQLLAFSRRQVLQPKVMDLRTTLSDLDRMLRRLIGEDLKLTLALPAELGNVRADPGQMEQVVMNLVVNARDAMPKGGAITVSIGEVQREGRPHVCLSVSDTGTGIPPDVISKIFEPFFTTKPRDRGTGLGLSTVYGIVEQSGGSIEVDSTVGKGTTFRIYLPRVDEEVDAVPRAEPDPTRAAGTPRTVLVVEDQAEVRRLTVKLLQSAGYQVLEAADGEQARAMVRHNQIDLLITDVVMPRESGVDLARDLARQIAGLHVLLMSGYTDDAIEHHGVLGTKFAFLEKPFTQASLTQKVAEVLSRPAA